MSYFDVEPKITSLYAYTTAAIFIVLMLLHVALDCHGEFQLTLVGTRAKIACSSLIYRKMLRLSSSARCNAGTSIVNLLSVEVAKFECLFYCVPYICMLPLQLLATYYLIWQTVGIIPASVGIALIIIQTLPIKGVIINPISMYISVLYYKISLKLQAKQSVKTDKRISLINEIVNGIRTVKLNLYEMYFEKLVYRARRLEISDFLKMSYLTSAMWALATFSHRLCSFIVALLYTSQYGRIYPGQILPINLHFFNLRSNFIYFFFGVRSFIDMRMSVRRIEKFLLLEETESKIDRSIETSCNNMISMKNVTASWDEENTERTLENISVDFCANKLYAIVGSPGSGKTSLLKVILRELQAVSGEVIIRGKISYASQDPWHFFGSIKDNILLGEVYDEDRYVRVTNACGLLDDFDQLPLGDNTLVGDGDNKLSESECLKINMARAIYSDADVYVFDDPFSTMDVQTTKMMIDNCVNGILKDKTRILVMQKIHDLKNVDEIVLLDHGKIKYKGCLTDFRKNDEYHEFILNDLSTAQQDEPSMCEIEAIVEDSDLGDDIITDELNKNHTNEESKESDHFLTEKCRKKSVYQTYVELGGPFLLTSLIAFNLIFILSVSGFDFELASWGQYKSDLPKNDNQTHHLLEKSYSSNIYDKFWMLGRLVIFIAFSAICKNVLLYKFIFHASQKIHNHAFACLIRTPLHFFEVNPSARILNLFSKITSNVDTALTQSLFESIQTFGHAIAILLPIYIVDWRNIFPTILSLYFYVKISKIYISCIQKLKKLVAKAKNPVLSFTLSSLTGLATINCCRAEKTVRKNFDTLQDRHSVVHFLAVALVQGFSFWMYLITVALFAIVLFGSIALKDNDTSAGHVGLSLMQVLSVGFLMASVVGYIVETMSCMTCVERMLQLLHLDKEDLIGSNARVSQSWPDQGEIEFRQVHLKYPKDDELVIKNMNFVVQAGTQVDIVGPTSSLIATLFRLAEFDGQLLIDGVDVRKVSLRDLRSKISVIPKEPILFSATLRKNLDPLNEFDDTSLWSALEDVELKHRFNSLDHPIDEDENKLCKTQRYQLYFARAILQKNKILVLDQVTDDVDSVTEAFIRHIVRTKFERCTVLVLAQQLSTAMDSEKVLVANKAEVIKI